MKLDLNLHGYQLQKGCTILCKRKIVKSYESTLGECFYGLGVDKVLFKDIRSVKKEKKKLVSYNFLRLRAWLIKGHHTIKEMKMKDQRINTQDK